MRIFMMGRGFSPYCTDGGSAAAGDVAAQMVRKGHQVVIMLPFTQGMDDPANALARRLKPVEADQDTFWRYEGRTPGGVEAVILQPQNGDHDDPSRFGPAMASLISQAADPDTRLIWWGSWGADALAAGKSRLPAGPLNLLLVDEAVEPGQGAAMADRVLVRGRDVAAALARNAGGGVGTAVEEGRAAILPLSAPDHPILTVSQKASAKASLQSACGLIVNVQLPLLAVWAPLDAPLLEALAVFLKGDVQVVVLGADPSVETLADRYPDRLAVVPISFGRDTVLAGADFCFVGDDPAMGVEALSFGVVPVVHGNCAECAVPLEPSLCSGSAIVYRDFNKEAVVVALGDANAAFHCRDAFVLLQGRIPTFVRSTSALVDEYLR